MQDISLINIPFILKQFKADSEVTCNRFVTSFHNLNIDSETHSGWWLKHDSKWIDSDKQP